MNLPEPTQITELDAATRYGRYCKVCAELGDKPVEFDVFCAKMNFIMPLIRMMPETNMLGILGWMGICVLFWMSVAFAAGWFAGRYYYGS